MTTMATRHEESPAQQPSRGNDWLPYTRAPTLSTKALSTRFIQTHKHRDWFLALAWAIEQEKGDSTQSKLLSKVYVFLRDFIPRGLGPHGDFAHIRGNDLMEQLLCHGETTSSRHKIGRHAEMAFADLEKWMGQHATWRDALKEAKVEFGKQRGVKKKLPWKAPGLHSPAGRNQGHRRPPQAQADPGLGMMAILVLAHPDDAKFKIWISRLQIEWMMLQPRTTLNVQDGGFWDGIKLGNLYEAFSLAEPREATVPMYADYNRLFGADFMNCRKDMRPYLPSWAENLSLREKPFDTDLDNEDSDESCHDTEPAAGDSGNINASLNSPRGADHDSDDVLDDALGDDTGQALEDAETHGEPLSTDTRLDFNDTRRQSIAPVVEDACTERPTLPDLLPANITALREQLGRDSRSTAINLDNMEEWLFKSLEDHSNKVLVTWCQSWERRINGVQTQLEQTIVRQLFTQSLRRLYTLSQNSSSLTKAYMLVDAADDDFAHAAHDVYQAAVELLQGLPEYEAFSTAFQQLIRHADSGAADVLTRMAERQTCLFHTVASGIHFAHCSSVIIFATIRLRILLQCTQEIHAGISAPVLHWRAKRDLLLREAATLKLTNEQLRALLVPGAECDHVLTLCQADLWRMLARGDAPRADDPRLGKPAQVLMPDLPAGSTKERYPDLQKLFRSAFLASTIENDGVGHPVESKPDAVASKASAASRRLSQGSVNPQSALDWAESAAKTPSRTSSPAAAIASRKRCASPDGRNSKITRLGHPGDAMPAGPVLAGGVVGIRSPNRTSSPLANNAWGGRTWSPRHYDTRDPKAYLRDELKSMREQLRADLLEDTVSLKKDVQSLRSAFTELKTDLVQQMASGLSETRGELESNLAVLETQLKASMTTELGAVSNDVKTDMHSVDSKITALESNLATSKDEADRLLKAELSEGLSSIRASLESSIDHLRVSLDTKIDNTFEALNAREEARPKLGEAGYLSLHCLAPPGWNQQDYEAQLERAAWFYLFYFDCPDDGVGQDAVALGNTEARFPNLNEDDIIMTLKHMHMRVYHFPMRDDQLKGYEH